MSYTSTLPCEIYLPIVSAPNNRAMIWMPYATETRTWLKHHCGERTRPQWDRHAKRWTVARAHFRTMVQPLADRYGSVLVIQDFTKTTVCTAQCQGARRGVEYCECSCGGEGHGDGFPADWSDGEIFVKHDRITRAHVVHANQSSR